MKDAFVASNSNRFLIMQNLLPKTKNDKLEDWAKKWKNPTLSKSIENARMP